MTKEEAFTETRYFCPLYYGEIVATSLDGILEFNQ